MSALRRHLALSTNNIEKISSLSGMESLRILSLSRNLIKVQHAVSPACICCRPWHNRLAAPGTAYLAWDYRFNAHVCFSIARLLDLQKIENLDAVADTLEELWISYNVIPGLVSFGYLMLDQL